jgi:membrane-bound lytic murein transglycosylase MltF
MVVSDVTVAADNRVGWAVRADNPLLERSIREFAHSVRQGTLIGNVLIERYLQDTSFVEDPVDEQSGRRMRELASLFQRYGERYGFDWLALMAQAYQESGLENDAVSRAGAVGIMQLRPSTAADPNVGIEDITDLENNVHAAAKYMAFMRDRYFSDADIDEAERLAFTWAAYNAGPRRVRRMRARAAEMGLDPNQWFGNVEYAALDVVGQETVRYVANIYKYWIAYQLLRPWEDVSGG